jgi:hypothetical protein
VADPTTSAAPPPEWVAHPAGPECECADGSEYWIHTLTQDPTKVMLYFQGGGACFTEAMCDFEDGTYKVTTSADDNPEENGYAGIFDRTDPANPLADWSIVFVPYCSGDVFLGDATTTYGDLTVEHNGFANGRHGLDFLVDNFPDAREVLVTGSSAGGVPSPLFGGLVADELPEATVSVLADGSGGYSSNPATNTTIGNLWGVTNNIPDWPELAGLDPAEFGIPDLFTFAGQHDPEIRMARYDNAFDEVQVSFAAMAGADASLLDVLDGNEAMVEAGGVDLDVYVAPGDNHTILARPDVYTVEVEGVAFVDWLTDFVTGTPPGDVHCVDCES